MYVQAPYDYRNQPVSRGAAATDGAIHEVYAPRYGSMPFPRESNPDRLWGGWLDDEADRINQSPDRRAIVFFDRGKVGMAVDCLTPKECDKKEPAETKRGMH